MMKTDKHMLQVHARTGLVFSMHLPPIIATLEMLALETRIAEFNFFPFFFFSSSFELGTLYTV